MSKKNIYIIISCVFILIVSFTISYNYGLKKYGEDGTNAKKAKNDSTVNVDKALNSFNSDETVSPSAKVILNIEYKKSEEVDKKEQNSGEFAGKTKQQIEAMGYTVEKISKAEVVLHKKVDSYKPGKYVVGIKDDYLAIFKVDNEGKLIIEDESKDITKIQTKKLKQGDIDLLVSGSKDFQFDTRDGAEAKIDEDFGELIDRN